MNLSKNGQAGLAAVFFAGAIALVCGACGKPAASANDMSDGADAGADGGSASAEEGAPKWDSTNSSASASAASGSSSGSSSGSGNASGSSTGLSTPAAHRTDVYDKEQTEIVLKRAARQVKANCGSATGSDGKAAGPWGTGTVMVTLGHNGHTKGATVGAPFEGQPPGRCAIQAFSNLTFPPWGGEDTTVSWDIEIPQPAK